MNDFKDNFDLNFYTSVSKKLLVSIFIISATVTIVVTIIQLSFEYSQEINKIESTYETIKQSYTKVIATAIWNINSQQIENALEGMATIPGISKVQIMDKDNVEYSRRSNNSEVKNEKEYVIDVIYNFNSKKHFLGKLHVFVNMDLVYLKLLNSFLIIFISQLIKTLFVSALIYWVIRKVVTDKLLSLAQFLFSYDISKSINSNEIIQVPNSFRFFNKKDEFVLIEDAILRLDSELKDSYEKLDNLNQSLEKTIEEKTTEILIQNEKLIASSRLSVLGEVAGGIAHEINNPLTIITSQIRMLKKNIDANELNEAYKENFNKHIVKIELTLERISKIIKGMKNVSRDATSDELVLCSIKDIIDDILPLIEQNIRDNSITVKCDQNSEVFSTKFTCNRIQMSQVILNLFSNSIDAISGKNDQWIELKAEKVNEFLMIKIIDSGNGISNEIADKIFNPFFTTKEIGKGTGLGLSLSYRIILGHKGKMYLDSSHDNTCFVIELPTV